MKTLSFLPAGALLWMFAISSYSQSALIINGSYSGDRTWQADTVKITGHTSISGQLVIEPGTLVEFQGNYTLETNGIKAIGDDGDEIVFTVHDTLGFSNLETESGGWGGITDYGASLGDSSVLRYCRFEYGKRITDPSPYFKGLLKFGDNTGRVLIEHCVFENNFAKDGAILKSDRNTELDHCRVNGNYSIGISLRMGDIKNCSVKNNKGNGIEIWDKEYTITNDTVIGNSGYGLYVYQSKNVSVRDNVISGNALGVKLYEVKTGEFYGKIADKTIWEADTIKVASDVTIGKQLVIRPGTCVEFQGHYELAADSLYAVGSIGDSITFTIQDTTGFSNRNILDGGWKKISVASFNEFNYCRFMYGKNMDSSSYPRPSFMYMGLLKVGGIANIKNSLLINNYSAGVLFEDSYLIILSNCSIIANEFNFFNTNSYHFKSDLSNCSLIGNTGTIENTTIKGSVFKNNKNLKLYASEDENLFIDDCIFQNNQDLTFEPAGASYSHFKLINTRIIDNDNLKIRCHDAGLIYLIGNIICNNTFKTSIEMNLCLDKEDNFIINNTFSKNKVIDGSALISSRFSFFNFYNNILFANDISNSKGILFSSKDAKGNIIGGISSDFRNNLIEGGLKAFEYSGPSGVYEDNMDEDPQFVNVAGSDFHLKSNSPCINTGISDTTGLHLPVMDLDGNPRIIGNRIDMGGYEFPGESECPTVMIAQGIYNDSDTWCADTVKVTGDVTVNGKLTVEAGTYVELQGYYKISAENLLADGIKGDSVIFTINDTTGFSDPNIPNGGWAGIGSDVTLKYCRVEYIKAVSNNIHWAITGHPEVFNSVIANNNNPYGYVLNGGIFKNSRIIHNLGIAIGGTRFSAHVDSCVISYNSKGVSGEDGGNLKLENSTVEHNVHSGIEFFDLYGSIISNNIIQYNGIGIGISTCWDSVLFTNNIVRYNQVGIVIRWESEVLISGNLIYGNNVGISLDYSDSYVVNNLLFDNINAGGEGAAIQLFRNSTPVLINDVIVNNLARHGSAIYFGGMGGPEPDSTLSKVPIYNCIIRNNKNEEGKQLYACRHQGGPFICNQITFPGSIYFSDIQGIVPADITGEFLNNIDEDPLFINTVGTDFHLSGVSPCINAGTSDTTGLHILATDIEGNPRIADLCIDIGAYEYSADELEILHQPEGIMDCTGESGELITNASGRVTGYQWQRNGADLPDADNRILRFMTLSKENKGKYNCIIYSGSGNFSTDTVNVFPLTTPEITDQTQSFGICEKQDTILLIKVSDPDSVSYDWYFGDELIGDSDHESVLLDDVNNDDEGKYYGITSNLCGSDTSSVIEVTVNLLPVVSLGEDTTLHTNDTLTLDAGEGFNSYLWNTGASAQVLPVNTSQTGEYEYWVKVCDSNSCAATDTILITVEQPDALPGCTRVFGLKVYPNPTTGIVYLVPQSDMDCEMRITVIDAEGRLVHKDKLTSLKSGAGFSIDLSGLENGIYLLMIDQYPVRIVKNDAQ